MSLNFSTVCHLVILVLPIFVSWHCGAHSIDEERNFEANSTRNASRNTSNAEPDLGKNASRPRILGKMVVQTRNIDSGQLQIFKATTIGLAVLCTVMSLVFVFIILRCKAKRTPSNPEEPPLPPAKQPAESEYQSIRGLPKRENEKSYVYETVKPRLPLTRPPLPYHLQSNERGYENLKSLLRDSNPYIPMNEALAGSERTGNNTIGYRVAGSILTGSAGAFSDGDEDPYLTMKKLIKTPEDASTETHELT